MAQIPPSYIDCVVAIGIPSEAGKPPKWVATGFFYGHPVTEPDEEGKRRFLVYLVSNRHVFEDRSQVCLRFSPQAGGSTKQYDLRLLDDGGSPLWFRPAADDADIAAIPVDFRKLRDEGMRSEYFHGGGKDVRTLSDLRDIGVMEGDFVYILGYPMGLVGERPTVIARMGIVARIRDTLADAEMTYLVDSAVFPGNSGGPVIVKPELASVGNTLANETASLIGVVAGYVPYEDIAVSQQTQQARIIFQENSGLAIVYPIDYVLEAIGRHVEIWSAEQAQGTPGAPDAGEVGADSP